MNQLPDSRSLTRFALALVALSSGLLAVSMLLMGSHRHIEMTLGIFGLENALSGDLANTLAAISFSALAVLSVLSVRVNKFKKPLALLLIAVALLSLASLFSEKMWMADLGGFPVIGSGQGVIKYFALLSIGLLLLQPNLSLRKKQWLAVFPVLVVLAWIGGMKFFEFEAQGIKALLETSPFMSWMYALWDLQTTSNLIGIFDLIAVILLVFSIYKPTLMLPAVAMSGSVMLMTQSFLFTLPGSLSPDTLLTTTGHFLIKDLWFIANLLLFVKVSRESE